MNLVDKTCEYTSWYTPPEIIQAIKQYFGLRAAGREEIDLDPATDSRNPVGARTFYTPRENGLAHNWAGHVFVNPPYGRVLPEWTAKIHEEAKSKVHIVALLPGQRFETAYWQEHILSRHLSGICFLRRRLKFLRSDGTAAPNNPYGSMLYVFNGNAEAMRESFSHLGKVVETWTQ